MKRIIYLLLFALLFCLSCSEVVEDDYAVISFFIGEVTKNNLDVEIGESVSKNDVISTGSQSSCDISIGNSLIRIKEKSKMLVSRLDIYEKKENTTLNLSIGKMLCRTKKLLKNESFLVKTPTAVAGVRGTRFIVEADKKKTTRIKVYKGRVKVLKNVKILENKVDKIMEEAPSLKENEKVVVTEKAVKNAEKNVEKLLNKESLKGGEIALVKVVKLVKNDVIVKRKEIKKFKIEDFKEEREEIITVKEKPKEVIKKIAKIIKKEKKKPTPEGSLLITRYEIYYIKNGKVIWKGNVIKPPLKNEDKLYVVSGSYIFCASVDGPVMWRKKVKNDGEIEIKEDLLLISYKGKIKKLDLVNGEER
ncbi:MAG: FecR family protein [Spirochaetota bacterium]|nr:FecR family protein [Spirochaetota bacterium]